MAKSSRFCLPRSKRFSLASALVLLAVTVQTIAAPITAKIIGGNPASNNDWPWIAALVYKSDITVFCGGSLIAKNWVLTAAHCVYNKQAKDLEVLVNKPQLQSNQGERIAVKQAIVHPKFTMYPIDYDIALLELKRFSSIEPIETLPDFSSQDEAGQNGIALGWGNISVFGEEYPDALQQVILPIISNTTCGAHMTGITERMLCAGFEDGGKDTCKGDSGGPLVVFDQESQSWRVAGITSFGQSACAAAGHYGVYTRLDKFKAFISQTICTASQIPAAPLLSLAVKGAEVTAAWSLATSASGYRLNYAPYPAAQPISSLAPGAQNHFSVALPHGSAYYVGISAYNGNCRSEFSNIGQFVVD